MATPIDIVVLKYRKNFFGGEIAEIVRYLLDRKSNKISAPLKLSFLL